MSVMRWEEMTAAELGEVLPDAPLVLLPLGSIEWHAAHCATGLDYQVVMQPIEDAAAEMGVVRLPWVYWGGMSPEGDLPGSLIVRTDTLERLLTDIIESVKAHGVRAVLGVSSHGSGGQHTVIDAINQRYADDPDILVHFDIAARLVVDSGINTEHVTVIDHAGAAETSIQMTTAPGRVQMDRLPAEGPLFAMIGADPRTHADGATGEAIRELFTRAIVHRGRSMIEAARARPRPAHATGSVTGQIERRTTAPPEAVREYVLLYNRRLGVRSHEIAADAPGTFTFADLPPGPYSLIRWRWSDDERKAFSQAGDMHQFTLEPGEHKRLDLGRGA